MENQASVYIEELYNNHMWVTESHRKLLYRVKEEKNLTDDELIPYVEKNMGTAKRNFSKVFKRMGSKRDYYSVPHCIFSVDEDAEIIITCKYKFQKLVGSYKVVISPFYNYDYSPLQTYEPYTAIIQANNNTIRIPYRFEKEDLYLLSVFYVLDNEDLLLLTTSVYALHNDLYKLKFYKADFHMHTTHSDGYEPPELVAVSARECGMDIIAVTDHNAFSGSVIAREKAAEMGLNMTVILGEEYSLEYSPMHILALGTKEQIDRKYLTKQTIDMPETKAIVDSAINLSCSPKAYACTQVLLEQVSRLGGVSILAHPYWKPIALNGTRMDTPENLYIELGKNKKFAGIEVVYGSPAGEFNVSNIQASLARTVLDSFDGIPILGITDSHAYTTDPISGKHFTVVFSESRSAEHVLNALQDGRTVAVEMVNGTPLCFGNHRLVKFTEFLLKYYFPDRDKEAVLEAQEKKRMHLLT